MTMMTKKRLLSSPELHHLRLVSKIVIYLCALCVLLVYLKFHFQFKLQFSTSFASSATHSFVYDDQVAPLKIAFLFLARGDLPLDFLWDAFFKNGDVGNFSIYVHSVPGFVFNETTTSSAFFYGRQLNNSIQVAWGESSMIEAEKLLFEAALDDPANQRFVLLSDSCVPLYNFSYIYSYLISSQKSFVDSFINVREKRYTYKMAPVIRKDKWRKGSQWISLVRRHAEIVVDDHTVLPVFKEFCKRWPSTEFMEIKKMLQSFLSDDAALEEDLLQIFPKRRNCIPDEHYVQTLLTVSKQLSVAGSFKYFTNLQIMGSIPFFYFRFLIRIRSSSCDKITGFENELERRTLTYSLWNESVKKGNRTVRSWHPATFKYADAAPQRINGIKAINHIEFESDAHRIEWCYVNHRRAPCFLFARKFTPGAAMRLMTEGFL
ncbi:hypothetical protein Tsubulata_050922 [Turnera subulata]|uniref:Uncharacterized protein n=1 Tax=Turnera subulata TaxID=218843 RepID=A0A9Q0F817_9ROSI|nr:hypothetical protein Tsubulata_050922 [Turnera subulata]